MPISSLTRRSFIAASGAAIASAAAFTKPIGLNLYTVRNQMPSKPEETIKAIAKIGYKEAQAYDLKTLPTIAPMLKASGMRIRSVHVPMAVAAGKNPDISLAKAIEMLKGVGAESLVVPYLMPNERGDIAGIIKTLNTAAVEVKKSGLKFGYHNHAFEFGGAAGSRPWDMMMKDLDPANVMFELDVFWLAFAGQDPVEIIQKLGNRVLNLHLKDKPANIPVKYSEAEAKKEYFKEVGNGSLNFPAILKAAAKAGVSGYFVEQDQTPGDPIDSLKQSYAYLSTVKL